MLISVVTVTRNNARTIAETIESVGSQTYNAVEHVVVDGASTDGTAQLARARLGENSVLVSEPDGGIYDAMNKGIGLATGHVVGTLNADDVYADTKVLAMVAEVFSDSSVDACHGDLLYVDEYETGRVVRYWRSRQYEPGLFRSGWMPAHPTFFVRRQVYERHGLFDLTFRYCADFELTMRFLEVHGVKSVHIPEVLVRMRTGGVTNRSVANIVRGNLESYRACRKHNLRVTPFFMLRKVLGRVPQFFRRP